VLASARTPSLTERRVRLNHRSGGALPVPAGGASNASRASQALVGNRWSGPVVPREYCDHRAFATKQTSSHRISEALKLSAQVWHCPDSAGCSGLVSGNGAGFRPDGRRQPASGVRTVRKHRVVASVCPWLERVGSVQCLVHRAPGQVRSALGVSDRSPRKAGGDKARDTDVTIASEFHAASARSLSGRAFP
jgi:hypothetical protein